MEENKAKEYFLDKLYAAKNTSRKEDQDIKDSNVSHPFKEVREDGGTKPYMNKKIAGAAGAVVGAGVGMAASNGNLKEWKSLRSKENKSPAEKARVKHLRRIISAKVGGGAIIGGASAAYLARK